MKLGATVYLQNSVEAVERYCKAFGLTLGYSEKFTDGSYMHASLEKDGQEIFCVSESRNDAYVAMMRNANLKNARPVMSYGLDFDTADEVEKAFAELSGDGTVILPLGSLPWSARCAEVVDKYGVYWYLAV